MMEDEPAAATSNSVILSGLSRRILRSDQTSKAAKKIAPTMEARITNE